MCDEGIIHKVKPNGISRDLISIFIEILRNRKQRVAFNAQGILGLISVLVHLLIHINDLSDNLQCNPKLFADDTSLFSTVKVP